MDFLHKWERKFGKYAISHLTRYIIMTYIAGYILMLIGGISGNYDAISSLLTLSPSLILKGQVWRIFSWLLIPPNSLTSSAYDLLTIIMLFVYYQLGSLLERMWGDFLYNVYIFTGLIMTIIGAFLLYIFTGRDYGALFSTYYVSLSIFLGFAMTFPEQRMLFMFFIPIKIKYLAIVDVCYLVYSVVQAGKYGLWLPVLVMIVCSLAGTILFFFGTRKNGKIYFKNRTQRQYQQKMRGSAGSGTWSGTPGRTNTTAGRSYGSNQGNRQENPAMQGGGKIDRTTFAGPGGKMPVHRCAVCGRTELDDPDLEFRFCSRCNGNYEYCSDHLQNHIHVQ